MLNLHNFAKSAASSFFSRFLTATFEREEERNVNDSLFLRHLEAAREQYEDESDACNAAIESSRAEFDKMSNAEKCELLSEIHGIEF